MVLKALVVFLSYGCRLLGKKSIFYFYKWGLYRLVGTLKFT